VIKLSCEPDGININNDCGSMHPGNLINAVREHKADFGIAFDGDGDRVLFVDNEGTEYNGDKLIYVILQAYLASNKKIDGVVGTVMTNIAMESALSKLGVKFVRAKVGDRYVLEELNTHGWTLGGEASGHILCLEKHTTGDGIISALQVVSAMLQLNKSLRHIVDWEDYPQTMINVRLNDSSANWSDRANPEIENAKLALGHNGRVIVRASGTEPLVRVMVEAKSLDDASKWASLIASRINS
jgi:phosphoglucosamine mutase